jgi:hypothetical protein
LISPTSEAHRRLQEWTRKVSSARPGMRSVWCLDLRHNPLTWEGLESALRHPALEHLQELHVNSDSPDELASLLEDFFFGIAINDLSDTDDSSDDNSAYDFAPLFAKYSVRISVNGIPVAALKANTVQDVDVGALSATRLQFAAHFLSPCTSLQSLKVSLEGCDPDMTEWMRLLEVILHFSCSCV